MAKHATTAEDETRRSLRRPTRSMRKMVMPELTSWKTPVIIDAVFGATDDPDMEKSFAVYCMMAPAPDNLCTVASPKDRTTAFTKACLKPYRDIVILLSSKLSDNILFNWIVRTFYPRVASSSRPEVHRLRSAFSQTRRTSLSRRSRLPAAICVTITYVIQD